MLKWNLELGSGSGYSKNQEPNSNFDFSSKNQTMFQFRSMYIQDNSQH